MTPRQKVAIDAALRERQRVRWEEATASFGATLARFGDAVTAALASFAAPLQGKEE